MQPGFFNIAHRLAGGKLYHCWFCRLQFYDARPVLDRLEAEEEAAKISEERQRRTWKLTG